MLKGKDKEKKKRPIKLLKKNRIKEKAIKVAITSVSLFLINIYIVLGIIYKDGSFTISLDSETGKEPNLIIYESLSDKTQKNYLKCEDIDFFSDVSIDWIPENIDEEAEGSHHGNHYMAYTFYVENKGEEAINYWTTAIIEEQDKEVDEALRFMVYKNGERVVYAKSAQNGNPEPGTIPFKNESTIMLEQNKDFKPGSIDKYTIVVFLEGSDPQCTNAIVGGEISMYMKITEEHITNDE